MNKNIEKLNIANELYSAGEIEKSTKLSLEVYKDTTDTFTKLQAINFLTSSLNKVEHSSRLLELCDEGIDLSIQLKRDDIKATYMAFKAELLMNRCMVLNYKIVIFKIAPGWKGFALESEKSKYRKLLNTKINYEKEANKLLLKAVKIAENIPDKTILVEILRSEALIYGVQRSILIVGGLRYPKLFSFFYNNFHIQPSFLFKHGDEIKKITNKCRNTFLKAIEITKLLNNGKECAYIFFSLANEMSSAGRKMESIKYLWRADKLARKLNEKILIKQILLLKKTIKTRVSKEYSKQPVFHREDY